MEKHDACNTYYRWQQVVARKSWECDWCRPLRITQRFDEEIEWDRTTLNSLSALCPCQARRPIVCEHDQDALEVALAMSPSGPDGPRMVFIHSTLKMEHALLSEGLLNDARANSNLEILSDPCPLRFGSDGYVDLKSYFRFGH